MAKIEVYEEMHVSRSVRVETETWPRVINATSIYFDGQTLVINLPSNLSAKKWEQFKADVDEGLREYERRWPVDT
jgi:3-deoxy-D-manno-octulosonic-acid transferase